MHRQKEYYWEGDGQFGWLALAFLVCIIALIYVWVPSEAQKDVFRTWKLNEPALGRWIHTTDEMRAVHKEIWVMPETAKRQLREGTYTAQKHFENVRRMVLVEKSLLPLEGGQAVGRGVIPTYHSYDGKTSYDDSGNVYRALREDLVTKKSELTNVFEGAPWPMKAAYGEMMANSGIAGLSFKPVLDEDWRWKPFWVWFGWTHVKSMGVVFFFFLLRTIFIEQKKLVLFGKPLKTGFWMFCWPVGIWVYPNDDPVEALRLVRRNLAMVVSAFFTVTVPNLALAQNNSGSQTKKDTSQTLVLEAQVVDQYYGPVVGEIFATEPAPRLLARYTRSTAKGQFYLDSWNSVGRGFNNEADLGGGWQGKGLDLSYTHFFVRGGDIEQLAAGKTFDLPIGRRKLPLAAGLLYYFGSGSNSPPGGVVTKLGGGFAHQLSRAFKVQHKVSAGLDNNPFGLGRGWTLMGFYKGQVDFKKFYLSWNLSRPLAGGENTTRGFRHGISAGWSHAFAW